MDLQEKLNELLSDLCVFYRKLQNYHWNIEGKDFFTVHAKLEEYYNGVNTMIDEIGEHILILGGQPLGTLEDYLGKTSIVEAENKKIKSDAIFHNIINDLGMLQKKAMEIKKISDANQEYTTSALMDDYLSDFGKKIWMLKQTIA